MVQDQWFRRAQMAVEKGQDELAREALTRKKAYEDNARSMKAQLDAQTKASDQLKANMTYVAILPSNLDACWKHAACHSLDISRVADGCAPVFSSCH